MELIFLFIFQKIFIILFSSFIFSLKFYFQISSSVTLPFHHHFSFTNFYTRKFFTTRFIHSFRESFFDAIIDEIQHEKIIFDIIVCVHNPKLLEINRMTSKNLSFLWCSGFSKLFLNILYYN